MHERIRPACLLVFFALFGAGCGEAFIPAKPQAANSGGFGAAYDEISTGSMSGTIRWQGNLPQAPPFKIFGLPGDYPVDVRKDQPNPNVPRIDPKTMALADVVVFLRNVDPHKAKPWDQSTPSIELHDRRIHINQGGVSSNVGWARVGATVEVFNRDPHFHMLRGRGAAFFSLPFAASSGPSRPRLDKPGVVELSSGSFFFWMHGYLLIAEHPYYARSDATGHFVLNKVPAGNYELVCWLPNWRVAKRIRDPETGLIIQVDFEPPVEHVRKVKVNTGENRDLSFIWSDHDFQPAK